MNTPRPTDLTAVVAILGAVAVVVAAVLTRDERILVLAIPMGMQLVNLFQTAKARQETVNVAEQVNGQLEAKIRAIVAEVVAAELDKRGL